jgi:hypothetical protein
VGRWQDGDYFRLLSAMLKFQLAVRFKSEGELAASDLESGPDALHVKTAAESLPQKHPLA